MSWFSAKPEGNLVRMGVELPLTLIEEGDSVIAYTPALDLSTCGKDKDEAKEMFAEAVRIFLNEIVKDGTVDEVLGGLGWTKDEPQHSWIPPKISQESFIVGVPA